MEYINVMSSNEPQLQFGSSYGETFLAVLSRSLAAPTPDWPTVRLWTKTSLDRLFRAVKRNIGQSKPRVSNMELLHWLEKLGLAWPVEADGADFYLLELGASARSDIDPLELLMAYEPSGVVCYFSALAFHSLTSQMPSHHHVAVVTKSSRTENAEKSGQTRTEEAPYRETIPKSDGSNKGTRGKVSPLGKSVFSYLDIPYYLTRRAERLLPGVQNRSNGPRGRFRITTYEQTLLDTFHKPQNCGGPAVVLEAWQEASTSGRLDEERLLAYLKQMDYPSTTRRLGAMLHLMDYTPGVELGNYLDRARQGISREAPHSQISLLPGFDYSNLDETWLVKSP
jgi:predicted transcriptional regulator of viral defense system